MVAPDRRETEPDRPARRLPWKRLMRAFLQRILLASQWGASLVLVAGCGSNVSGSGGSGGGTGGTTTGTTGPVPDGGVAVGNLDPLPTPVCSGPVYDGGYYGQCCEIVLCEPPTDGACSAADVAHTTLAGLPPGSGECECSPIRGPYAGTADGGAATCCYLVGSISCEGRPLLVAGEARLAEVIAAPSAWCSAPPDRDAARRDFAAALAALDAAALPVSARARLAQRWAERARNEHASVASFGRFSIALMALAAPPALVESAHQAAIDEIDHARLCLSLASAYGGEPLGFGPLRVDGAFAEVDSLEAAAVATVIEGCVGETIAALEMGEAAAQAGPLAVRLALTAIAEDEARHAELGWAFVRWALGTGDARLAVQVRAAFAMAMDRAVTDGAARDAEPPPEHGFLPGADVVRLRRRAVAEVIRPAAAALLGRRGALAVEAPRAAG
jgi:hypothetical protein